MRTNRIRTRAKATANLPVTPGTTGLTGVPHRVPLALNREAAILIRSILISDEPCSGPYNPTVRKPQQLSGKVYTLLQTEKPSVPTPRTAKRPAPRPCLRG